MSCLSARALHPTDGAGVFELFESHFLLGDRAKWRSPDAPPILPPTSAELIQLPLQAFSAAAAAVTDTKDSGAHPSGFVPSVWPVKVIRGGTMCASAAVTRRRPLSDDDIVYECNYMYIAEVYARAMRGTARLAPSCAKLHVPRR